jgi:triosephosphate isomerase
LRTPLIAGNWKMHKTVASARALTEAIVAETQGLEGVELLLGPPATALAAVSEIARPAGIHVAAQDMHWADKGAFTGAISPTMVAELAGHVILGHSERRSLFGETDLEVNRKVHAAIAHGLSPIVCVGETQSERAEGETDTVVLRQLAAAYEGIGDAEAERSIVAYEPVWAIGTGLACDPQEAARVMALLRGWLNQTYGSDVASRMRLLYGGSVKPNNIDAYAAIDDIDGALVGGASLEANSFVALARASAVTGGAA